jgi:hypothetical protein
MTMKKFITFTMVIFAALAVCACSTPSGKIVYDPALPAEKTTLVVFDSSIYILAYNGIDVSSTWYPNDKLRTNKITLPAGDTSIRFNLRAYFSPPMSNITYNVRMEDVELRYNFEAGKEYTFTFYYKSQGFLKKYDVGVAIWDYASLTGSGGQGNMLKSWKLGEI